MAVAYPENSVERNRFLASDLLGLPFEIKWLLSWTSTFGAGQQLCPKRVFCVDESHSALAIQAWPAGEAMRAYDARSIFFSPAVSFNLRRGPTPSLEPLVEQSFQEIHQPMAANAT